MVTYYGMSDRLPNISYYDTSGEAYGFTKPYSESRAQAIDEEVQAIIDSQYERARQLLDQYEQGHHELADLLQQREVIYTEDVERIFGPRQWQSRTETILKDEPQQNVDDNVTTTTPPPFEQNDNE